MSDYIDDRIEGNFVFLAVRATDGSGRRAGVDLPMDPDELARFEGEQGLMAPSDYRIDGYSKDGIVGRMGFAPFRDDSPLEDVNLLCRAVDAASRSDPHAADKVAAWAECWEVDDPRVLAGVAVRSADIPIHRYSRPRGMDDLQWRGLDPLGRLGASMSEERGLYGALRSGGVADSFDYAATRTPPGRTTTGRCGAPTTGTSSTPTCRTCLPCPRAASRTPLRPSRPERPSWIRPTRRTWP
mgnify:CR=1 FL=1